MKPRASGGGHGVRLWHPGDRIPRGSYLQEQIDGVTTRLFDEASALARAVAEEFNLIGVNGIDFIAREDRPWPIEVNPRWCSSMELVERASGVSVFAAHAAACSATLSSTTDLQSASATALARPRRSVSHEGGPHFRGRAVGKAIVFARHDVVIGDTDAWLDDDDIRDVPHAGERIAAGRPVCTVFAKAHDAGSCHAALVERAARIYAQLDRWRQEAA